MRATAWLNVFYCLVNNTTYVFKILINFGIGKTQYLQPIRLKEFCAVLIVTFCRFFIMLRTIKFNDQSCSMTIKIDNNPTDHLLPLETKPMVAQKVIPEMLFLSGGIFSQLFCGSYEFSQIRQRHIFQTNI